METGEMTLLDSAIGDFLRLTADYGSGLAWCSAEKIRALCPRGIGLRDIQRSLARLVSLGRIKRFRSRGRRGNYPILCGNYFVRSASLNWHRVNLEKTTDWRNIQYDSVTDPSELASEVVTRLGDEESCLKELREKEPENQERSIKTDSDSENENENESGGFREKQPTGKTGAAIDDAFTGWDMPKDGVLRIGPDLLASLYLNAARLRSDEKCEAALSNMKKAWSRAWKKISAAEHVLQFFETAKTKSSGTRMWIDAVFLKRCAQIERGELKVTV
jgi:hypothetical protein